MSDDPLMRQGNRLTTHAHLSSTRRDEPGGEWLDTQAATNGTSNNPDSYTPQIKTFALIAALLAVSCAV